MSAVTSFKFLGHGARVCNLPGTCRFSATLLREWTSRWIFAKPTLVVGGGVGRDTMRNMQTVDKRKDTIDRICELTWKTDIQGQFKNITEFSVKNIKRTVWRGGTYLGVCNGAYIAGKKVMYNDCRGDKIIHGGIGLFPGTTRGPMYPNASVHTESIMNDSGGMPVNVVDVYGNTHTMWYHNGGTFQNAAGKKRTKYCVHAVYDTMDQYPAIVSFRYGSGTVILSGVHPEFDGEGMTESSYRLFDGIFGDLGVINS